MSIPFVNITGAVPYCTVQDVKNLIGGVLPITQGTFTDSLIQTNITHAQRYIENACSRKFSPSRQVIRIDGNGRTRMVLSNRPFININSVKLFFFNSLNVLRTAYDYELNKDFSSGVLGFPAYFNSPTVEPFAFSFVPGSKNIEIDLHVGYSRDLYAQPMKSTDRRTYTFASTYVANRSLNQTTDGSTPPIITPIVYLNGVALTNTNYAFTNVGQANASWSIATDSLRYVVNKDALGIHSITFPAPLQVTDVVTADVTEVYVPEDVAEATAKRAAIECLSAMAVSWSGDTFDGLDQFQSETTRFQFHESGRFGHQITLWGQDVDDIIKRNTKIALGSIGGGYSDSGGGF